MQETWSFGITRKTFFSIKRPDSYLTVTTSVKLSLNFIIKPVLIYYYFSEQVTITGSCKIYWLEKNYSPAITQTYLTKVFNIKI